MRWTAQNERRVRSPRGREPGNSRRRRRIPARARHLERYSTSGERKRSRRLTECPQPHTLEPAAVCMGKSGPLFHHHELHGADEQAAAAYAGYYSRSGHNIRGRFLVLAAFVLRLADGFSPFSARRSVVTEGGGAVVAACGRRRGGDETRQARNVTAGRLSVLCRLKDRMVRPAEIEREIPR